MASQEKGIRSSCALPYELYADGKLSADKKSITVSLKAGIKVFGSAAAGSSFFIYMHRLNIEEKKTLHNRAYAVAAGDVLKDDFEISGFEKWPYHLSVYGPNGFYREFSGNENDPLIDVIGIYEMIGNRPTGKLALQFNNLGFETGRNCHNSKSI
jgi:phospholipase C